MIPTSRLRPDGKVPISPSRTALLAFAVLATAPAGATVSPVMEALKTELARTMEILGEQPVPPYFLSYEVTERGDGLRERRVRCAHQ